VADQIKVIRNPETQESKGFAFIEAPNQDEMQSIIKRFDRAPLEDRLLRANPAQPPKGKRPGGPMGASGPMAGGPMQDRPPRDMRRTGPPGTGAGPRRDGPPAGAGGGGAAAAGATDNRRRNEKRSGPPSAFAEELAKAL